VTTLTEIRRGLSGLSCCKYGKIVPLLGPCCLIAISIPWWWSLLKITMSEFGQNFKEARHVHGLTLLQISDKTNISVSFLKAIEDESFHLLPGGIFNVSFVRQYAAAVSLDVEKTVEDFRSLCTVDELDTRGHLQTDLGVGTIRMATIQIAEQCADIVQKRRDLLTSLGSACLLFSLGLGLYWSGADNDTSDVKAHLDRTSKVKENSPEVSVVDDVARNFVSDLVEVDIEVVETAWVRAVSDGRRVFEKNLSPGDKRSIKAKESVRLLIGNAAGVFIALNGKPQPSVGKRGQVCRVVLTTEGMEVVAPPSSLPAHVASTDQGPASTDGSHRSIPASYQPARD